jgi:hypothetical protein
VYKPNRGKGGILLLQKWDIYHEYENIPFLTISELKYYCVGLKKYVHI